MRVKNNFEKTGVRNIAYLTSKPNEVALTALYINLVNDSELSFNPTIFSTISGIVKKFGEDTITEREFSDIIVEIKTKPNLFMI